jgi:tetratricopeptide (TPR) repeat protein
MLRALPLPLKLLGLLLLGLLAVAPAFAASPGRDMAREAHAALLDGDAARALELANKALGSGDLDAEDQAVTLKLRGAAHHALGEVRAALDDYSQAIALFPHYAEAYVNRAAAWYDLGDAAAALADLDQAIRLKPDAEAAYFNRARVREAMNDITGAVRDYNASLILVPDNPPALVARARLYTLLNAPDLALADYDQAATLAPNASEPFLGRGALRLRKADLAGAEADFRRAASLAPDLAAPRLGLSQAARMRGDLKQAEDELTAALRLDPRLSAAYNDRGALREATGRTKEALEDYSRAVELARSPQEAASSLANRGLAARRLGRLPAAATDLAKAAALVPDNARFHALHGDILLDLGDPAAAEADLSRALALAAPPKDTVFLRAEARRRLGRLAEAEADLTACLESSCHPLAALRRGLMRLALDRPDEAAADLRPGAGPNAPNTATLLHLAELRAGRPGDLDLLRGTRKALKNSWPAPVLRFLLAEIPARDLEAAAGQDAERATLAALAVAWTQVAQGQRVEAVRTLRAAEPTAPAASIWTTLLRAELARLGF